MTCILILHIISYRSAMTRLRRLGRSEFDVSSERLTMRPRIEEELDKILQAQSFHRVIGFGNKQNSSSADTEKTAWDRSLWLYERVNK